MPSLQVPPASTPSALSKFTTRDKLLLAQAVHELGDEPPEWGRVASLMLAHPIVRDPSRLEEVQAAGITIGRVFGTRECERAWTALMRQRGLVLQPGEVGAQNRNPAVEARNRKEARGAPPRTDKKSQLALAQLLYAERMEEIKESLRGKEMQYKNLLAYIASLESGALDEVLAEELRQEAINATLARGEGRGDRTRSGASSTSSIGVGLSKRGSSSYDSDMNDSLTNQELGASGSQDSALTNTGRKRRAAAIAASSSNNPNSTSSPGTPSNQNDKEKDHSSPSGSARPNTKKRNEKEKEKEKEKSEKDQESNQAEKNEEELPSKASGGNKRKRGGNEAELEHDGGSSRGEKPAEVEESLSSKKAKTEPAGEQEEGLEVDETEPSSTKRTRSTRSSIRNNKQDQEENEDQDGERNSRTSLSPVSGGTGVGGTTKDNSNTRTSSRLRRDSSAANLGNRNRGLSNASATSIANATNVNAKSDAQDASSPTNTRKTRGANVAESSGGKNPNSGREKEKSENRKRKEKVLLMLWQEVAGHRNANLFQDSVKEADAPGYYSLIRHPIDLKQIKASIKSGVISSTTQLKRSLNQMFANALVYNREGTDVHRLADEMRKDVEEILENHEKLMKEG